MHIRKILASLAVAAFSLELQPEALAWHDRTHLAIAEAAGFDLWYSAAAPDVAKSKAPFTPIESPNHYFNNNAGREVTAEMVRGQVDLYDRPDDIGEGHLYGAMIGSVRAYRTVRATGKYARYPLAYLAHYAGDLSMPLHNTGFDDFNRARHGINDGVIDAGVRDSVASIRKRMEVPVIGNEADFAREVARVAELARRLGMKMRRENRDMTAEEAYTQVTLSASLLKAVLAYAETPAAPAAENKP
ncbi:MAG: hypothetical protein HGB04_03500 [Chlorobiaceae bacterium]|nr:hypothetical protein [Chlorobiaceae bacterium]